MFNLFASGHHPPALESFMEVNNIIGLIERLGLPAVIIGATFFYIYKMGQSHRDEVRSWQDKDTQADGRLIDVINLSNKRNEAFQQALNDQTLAIKDLVNEIRFMKNK